MRIKEKTDKVKTKRRRAAFRTTSVATIAALFLSAGGLLANDPSNVSANTYIDPMTKIVWSYTVKDGKATGLYTSSNITENKLTNGTLVVPNEVGDDDSDATYPVVSIGKDLGETGSSESSTFLQGTYDLNFSIDLSQTRSLERINSYAFYGCNLITSINIPETVQTIGMYAFYECSSLTVTVLNPNTEIVAGSADSLGMNVLKGYSQSTAREYFDDQKAGENHWRSLGDSYKVAISANEGNLKNELMSDYFYAYNGMAVPELKTVASRDHYTLQGYQDASGKEYYTYSEETGQLTRAEDTFTGISGTILSLQAQWVPETYPVVLYLNDGTVQSGNVTDYTYADGVTLPTDIYRKGYTFRGWYETNDFSGGEVTNITDKDYGAKEYYAKWEANQYYIRFHKNDRAGEEQVRTILQTYDQPIQFTEDFQWDGYDIQNWNTKSDGSGTICDAKLGAKNLSDQRGDVVDIYAIWTARDDTAYTVQCVYEGVDGSSDDIEEYRLKGTTDREYTPDADQWGKVAFISPETQTKTIKGDGSTIFRYYFARQQYNIDIQPTKGVKEVSGERQYKHGTKVTLKAEPCDGYRISDFSIRGDNLTCEKPDASTVVFAMPSSDISFTVKAEPKTYTITYETDNGTIREPVEEYTYGEQCQLPTKVDRPGFTFAGWYEDSDFSGDAVTELGGENDLGNKKFYAKWTTGAYEIKLDAGSGKINETYPEKYWYYTETTLPTDVTRKGYSFLGWWDGSKFVTKITNKDFGDKSFVALWSDNNKIAKPLIETEDGDQVINTEAAVGLLTKIDSKKTGYYYTKLDSTGKKVYATLYNRYQFVPKERAIRTMEDFVIRSDSQITEKQFYDAGMALVYDHPDIFWVSYYLGAGMQKIGGKYFYIVSPVKQYNELLITGDALVYSGYFNTAIKDLEIKSSDSVYQKLVKIHTYVASYSKYNKTGYTLNESTSNDTRSVGRMLSSRIGCCEGYAKLTKIFCDYYGISCVLVSSNNHMWNQVKLDGKWYGVDVTSDGYNNNTNFFLKGSKKFTSKDFMATNVTLIDSDGKPITKYACLTAPTLSSNDYVVKQKQAVKKNAVYKAGSLKVKVTSTAAKNRTVTVTGICSKKKKSINIPATVKLKGYTFKVRVIGKKALKGCKKLKSATIGKNVYKIGKNAFEGCKKIKKITIKGKNLKSVGKNALKGTPKNLKIVAPKKQQKKYQKLMNR